MSKRTFSQVNRAPSSWLPLKVSGQNQKDLATPTQCTRTTVERMKKRFQRSSGSRTVEFPWNPMSRMLVQDAEPKEKSARYTWRIAHAETWPVCPVSLTQRSGPCAVCKAPSTKWCVCGAELASTTRLDLLQDMVKFVRNWANPIYRPWDPQDQADMLCKLKQLLHRLPSGLSKRVFLRKLLRLTYLAGLTSNFTCVSECGTAAMQGHSALQDALTKRKNSGATLFRGGQYPGHLTSPSQIAEGLRRFEAAIGDDMVRCLQGCSQSSSLGHRRQCFQDAIKLVASTADKCNSNKVCGIADYKAKKISEALLLVCCANVGGLHYDISDMDAVVHVWPLPLNSRKALTKIFPTVHTDYDARQAMRVLQRALGSPEVDCCTLTAMLCFRQEHDSGVLQWVDV